mmetsp:Transcript_83677/g.249729  ORF Transcript_83677/g.249729 Transcript_83677/m.249729 type:complete len:369 (+) Transcript_83677:164-1270(+)
MGYTGPILEDSKFKRDVAHLANWDETGSEIDAATSGFIVSVFALGCMFSAFPLVSGFFLDILGRKVSLMLGSLVFLLGSAIQAACSGVGVMLVGRFISGCSICVLSTVVPLYQSELAPPHLRGTLTAIAQVMAVFGIAVASLADALLLPLAHGWRWAVLLPVLPGVVLFVGMLSLPRSPRWWACFCRTWSWQCSAWPAPASAGRDSRQRHRRVRVLLRRQLCIQLGPHHVGVLRGDLPAECARALCGADNDGGVDRRLPRQPADPGDAQFHGSRGLCGLGGSLPGVRPLRPLAAGDQGGPARAHGPGVRRAVRQGWVASRRQAQGAVPSAEAGERPSLRHEFEQRDQRVLCTGAALGACGNSSRSGMV